MSEGPTHLSIARVRAGSSAGTPAPAPVHPSAHGPTPAPGHAPLHSSAHEPTYPSAHEPTPAPTHEPTPASAPGLTPTRSPTPALAAAPAPGSAPVPAPSPGPARVDAAAVHAALAEVVDPELPMVSIMDLGMIGAVEIDDPADGSTGAIRVDLLPTFVGCPALGVIRDAVAARLEAFGRPVAVETTFSPPWTTDRVTNAGRRALTAAGIAAPSAPEDVRCPYCRSARVVMDSAFGPTQCRSLYYCRDCRQPFEAMKLV